MKYKIKLLFKKVVVLVFFIFFCSNTLFAYDPRESSKYDSSADNMFWFIQITDTHIGQTDREAYNEEFS